MSMGDTDISVSPIGDAAVGAGRRTAHARTSREGTRGARRAGYDPAMTPARENELLGRIDAFLEAARGAPGDVRVARRSEARELARAAKSAGIDLCHDRGTERSPRVGVLFLAAAKLALLGWDEGERPARFLRDVERDAAQRAALERFATSLAPS